MPFTISHAAIALPFRKYSGRYVSMTGLIIGSMAPDFEYFFRMKVVSYYSHTIGGLFYFDLPVAIFLSFLFHNLIRDALYDNLPHAFKGRVEGFKSFKWNQYFHRHYVLVMISMLLGAASHLLWDSFTHVDGYSVRAFTILQRRFSIAGYDIPIYKLLQHGSTLIAAVFIAYAFFALPGKVVIEKAIDARYWIAVFVIVVVVVGLRLTFGIDQRHLDQLIATGICGIVIALTFAPVVIKL